MDYHRLYTESKIREKSGKCKGKMQKFSRVVKI